MTTSDWFSAALAAIGGAAALYVIVLGVLGGPDAWLWLLGRLFAFVLG